MKLNTVLSTLLTSLGGSSLQSLQLQQAVAKATTQGANRSTQTQRSTGNNSAFATLLGQIAMPTPPADLTNPQQLATYNQQLLTYINQMMAVQATQTQRMASQLNQLVATVQRLQQSGASTPAGSTSTGTNTTNPTSANQRINDFSNYKNNSLLLDDISSN
jgi:uncharacterized coiled-coil protein SlyX